MRSGQNWLTDCRTERCDDMANLSPDTYIRVNGVMVKSYLLTEHNPNRIDMPSKRVKPLAGVTIHNTGAIKVSGTTMAEQYTRATKNGNMNSVRVHYYVDDDEAWQSLPLTWQSWHAGQKGKYDANGSEAGNAQTISVECIMKGDGSEKDIKAEDNAARLIAWLCDYYGLNPDKQLFTHNYWCNVRNGIKGTVRDLNIWDDGYKKCPIYIRPHWDAFVAKVKGYMKKAEVEKPKPKYYVQVGAFSCKETAEEYLRNVRRVFPDAFIKVIE